MALMLLFLSGPAQAEKNAVGTDGASATESLPGSKPEITLTDRGRIQLHVADLPLSTALQLLSVQSHRNIVASPAVKGTVTANLFDVTFEEALRAILTPNRADFRQVGNFIYIYTYKELQERAAAAQGKTVIRVFSLNHLTEEEAAGYVATLLEEGEQISRSNVQGGDGKTGSGSESMASAQKDFLMVTARPEKIRQIEEVLQQIDIRPKQVLVEATILRANLTDNNSLGIDFTLLGGVDLTLLGATSTAVQQVTLGALPTDRLERFNAGATTDFVKDVPTGGITFGILKDHVAVFLRALEEVTDTTVLANPKVLALNKQEARVIVGRRDGFLTTTVTETQTVQTVEYLETGTQLTFRPTISRDGSVRLQVHPEDSVGFVNAQGLPTEQTTEVTTNIILHDNETVLIGGLFREVTTDARNQVPLLGSIPLIGPFFRSNSDATAREEVIILLTIHIIKDSGTYARESARERENIERIRVGLRKGLMWYGKDRLAQTYYERAWKAFQIKNPRKALWYLNLALQNNARLLPAIQLKEKILGQRTWDADGVGTRTFLHRLIARERKGVWPPFGRPDVPALGPTATDGHLVNQQDSPSPEE